MPDFFAGSPAPLEWFPPDTEEKGKKLGEFFQGPANPPATAGKVPSLVQEITDQSGGVIKKWGHLGLCWGGKVRGESVCAYLRRMADDLV